MIAIIRSDLDELEWLDQDGVQEILDLVDGLKGKVLELGKYRSSVCQVELDANNSIGSINVVPVRKTWLAAITALDMLAELD